MTLSPDQLPGFLRPECMLRPSQLFRRILRPAKLPATAESRLPWGLTIRYHPHEVIGREIWKLGIFEMSVCEVLWRLTDPGENALDIGSNIGQMASLLAARVGSTGSVACFEPHPAVYGELAENAAVWARSASAGKLTLFNEALSDRAGTLTLRLPAEFSENRGIAHISDTEQADSGDPNFTDHSIKATTLDAICGSLPSISVIKIDVEGHELSVFKGAGNFFAKHRPRDIVFEDHQGYPSSVTRLLESCGYKIFNICSSIWGPYLQKVDVGEPQTHRDYLATLNSERALSRVRRRGWSVLNGA